MKALLIAWALVTTGLLQAEVNSLPDELVNRLRSTLRQHCPDLALTVEEGELIAKKGTMLFTVHGRSKSGEIFPQTYQEEGPNFKGFMLRIKQVKGVYEGAAVVPQTLRGPYYSTYIAAPATKDGLNYYWVRFSFGGRLDENLKNVIYEAIESLEMNKREKGTPADKAP